MKKSPLKINGDFFFGGALGAAALAIVCILVLIFVLLFYKSLPAMKHFGPGFVTGTQWDPVNDEFGAFPFIVGTLVTSFAAILLTIPLSVATSLFIREYAPPVVGGVISHMVDLLAAIPSVIYGMWGIFAMVPVVRLVQIFLNKHASFVPFLSGAPYGVGLMAAIIILVIMTLPYSISITRDVMNQVPLHLKEGAYALGATRWTMVRKIIIPYCRNGIMGGTTLALGRALGETMAVTMVIGNSTRLPRTLFDPANTIASIIANQFNEASGTLFVSALINLALILFLISFVINTIGRIIIHKVRLH
ncbi:MAG TPA: phosphate ABC transporter permease subunit PstC [Candidatus Sumerlaeota bacterium]|nr:phosphate ABC transporter permease subunit PstC [Candidatus Sumerlaeota bacterium]